jgi:drug/metabolite transporter (DMT)-like permease
MDILGIAYALIALIGWGLGDFFAQRSTRIAGVHETLFAIRIFVVAGLLPFVWHEMPLLSIENIIDIGALSLVSQVYAATIYTAFKRGKISVVESVVGLELPLTVALSVLIGGERLSGAGLILFVCVTAGILFAVTRTFDPGRKSIFEKGAFLALIAAVLAAIANFGVGTYAIHVGPLVTLWLLHVFLLAMSVALALYKGKLNAFVVSFPRHLSAYVPAAVFDTMGSLGFVLAVPLITISLTTTISESYLALAALLGVVVNGERLRRHQYVGSAVAIGSVIIFARFFSV